MIHHPILPYLISQKSYQKLYVYLWMISEATHMGINLKWSCYKQNFSLKLNSGQIVYEKEKIAKIMPIKSSIISSIVTEIYNHESKPIKFKKHDGDLIVITFNNWVDPGYNMEVQNLNLDKDFKNGMNSIINMYNQFVVLNHDNSIIFGKNNKVQFEPPSYKQVKEYCESLNYSLDAKQIYDYYSRMDWRDSRGKMVKNWKNKIKSVWCKPENCNDDTFGMVSNPGSSISYDELMRKIGKKI